tara:strand:+ start:72 stop:275 length:204 start_codon:yes stop_codon:yes gene_type:complete
MRITDREEAMTALGALLCGYHSEWEEQAPILKQKIKREWRREFIREQLCFWDDDTGESDKIFARLIR